MTAISLQNQTFFYQVQRQARKSFCLQITAPDTLLIKAPLSMSDNEITSYIKKKERWLLEKNSLLKTRQDSVLPTPETLPFLGRQNSVDITKSLRRPSIKIVDDKFLINLYEPTAFQLPHLLGNWYAYQATDYLKKRTAFWSTRLGTTVNRIAVKDQKTRWGSCSSLGNINYNWRLIMAPPEVIDYIVIHETAHRLILNHSKEFWEVVAKHAPDYQAQKDWLQTHGAALLNFSLVHVASNIIKKI